VSELAAKKAGLLNESGLSVIGEELMHDEIRWGFTGTGLIAGIPTKDLSNLPDARLVAVGSRTRASAEAFRVLPFSVNDTIGT
jgi:hypothetical protein